MIPGLNSNFKKPTLAHAVLLGLVFLACTVDFSRQISIAHVSGLGALSLAACGIVWAVWLIRPVLPPKLLIVFLPLMLFVLDAVGTLLWYSPKAMDGAQLLVVAITFLGTMMLTARESADGPLITWRLRSALMFTSVLPVFAWMGILLTGRVSGPETNLTRPFALYSIVICAVAISVWRGLAWPETRRRWSWKSLWPLAWVLVVAYVVLLGFSRTALIAIALLIPLSLIYRGNFKNIFRGTLMLAVGVGAFSIVLFNYQPLYDRFFKEDASMKVAGVSFNGSGRTRIWNLLFSTLGDDWVFGKGISSSEDIINKTIPNIGQPHNDYLRFYYDQGVVGLALWGTFIAGFVFHTAGNMRRSIRNQSPDYPQHLAALLALTGVSISMCTDNSYCYAFVMFPLAILMGSSLGLGRYYEARELALRPLTESAFFEPIRTPAS
jgi:O-antigen ligase